MRHTILAFKSNSLVQQEGIAFIETSAKLGTNVNPAFINIATEIKSKLVATPAVRRTGVNISRAPAKQKKKCALL